MVEIPEENGVMKKLVIERSYQGDRCRLALSGELRHDNSSQLFSEVIGLFDSGVTDLLLDFLGLDYVDTAGLQSLVRIYKHVSDNENLKFRILAHEGEMMEILRTCRFDKFIPITLDPDEASGDWQREPV